jgi:hypothetical protein
MTMPKSRAVFLLSPSCAMGVLHALGVLSLHRRLVVEITEHRRG